ncbi:MAG: hypothetical protein AB1736_03760 [Chloroflexota bacterium]
MNNGTQRRSTIRASRRTACVSATTERLHATVHPHEASLAAGSGATASRGRERNAARARTTARARNAAPAPLVPARIWARVAQRELQVRGLSAIEASNVVAYFAGLHAGARGWSIEEIDRLVALRARVACGVVTP